MDQTVYHVLLEGRTVGPYDRRTIVGMRIKKALTSANVLMGTDGTRLTVGDLIGRKPATSFPASRSGSFSVVHASYPAGLVRTEGRGAGVPRFKGEVEARVQGDVLRLAGRYRRGWSWKDGRIKIGLKEVVHARVAGSQVELWLRNGRPEQFQRITLELFMQETAAELARWFSAATPLPAQGAAAPAVRPAGLHGLWIAVTGASLVLGVLLMVLLRRGH